MVSFHCKSKILVLLINISVISLLICSCNSSQNSEMQSFTNPEKTCFSSKSIAFPDKNLSPVEVLDYGSFIALVLYQKDEESSDSALLKKIDKATMRETETIELLSPLCLDYCKFGDKLLGSTYTGFIVFSLYDGSIIHNCNEYSFTYGDSDTADYCPSFGGVASGDASLTSHSYVFFETKPGV